MEENKPKNHDAAGLYHIPFDEKWTPEPNSGCWLWTKGVVSSGYGEHYVNGKPILAHRFAWIQRFGTIPIGLNILHRCDTKLCVNPQHLFLGTLADNNYDMAQKGRARPPILRSQYQTLKKFGNRDC
jgi:hypothetical protein